MILHKFKIPLLFSIILLSITLVSEHGLSQSRFYKEIDRKNERELKVKISGGVGAFYILPGSKDKIAIIDGYLDKPTGKNFVNVKYFVDDEIGYLEFEMTKTSSGSVSKDISKDERWYIKLCDNIPTTLDVELGAAKADIELGGLSIKNLKISTGVSSTNVKFTKPNKIMMKRFEIEAGVAKFDGEMLGNAKFKNLDFSGGMGDFDLDFSGELIDDADINISIGFGNLDVYLPKDIGAIIRSSGFLSSKKFDDFYKSGDKFISFNINEVNKKVNINIESGLGNIRVKWIE